MNKKGVGNPSLGTHGQPTADPRPSDNINIILSHIVSVCFMILVPFVDPFQYLFQSFQHHKSEARFCI